MQWGCDWAEVTAGITGSSGVLACLLDEVSHYEAEARFELMILLRTGIKVCATIPALELGFKPGL